MRSLRRYVFFAESEKFWRGKLPEAVVGIVERSGRIIDGPDSFFVLCRIFRTFLECEKQCRDAPLSPFAIILEGTFGTNELFNNKVFNLL